MNSLGACATLACVWEATAPKPGNVYRGADFEDLTYTDLLTSAVLIGPILEKAAERNVGAIVLAAVEATHAAVSTNANLGMLLLMAPLAAVPRDIPLAGGIANVLLSLDLADTRDIYAAIRLAHPGGLGRVEEADVNDGPPAISPVAAMGLAAERDLVARQYTNDFADVFAGANRIERFIVSGLPLGEAIVRAYLQVLAEQPDSLVARKCGSEVAQEVSGRAAAVLASGDDFPAAVAEFDVWLRSDGHRRNPGTTADLIAAGLFVLLREGRLNWPVRFY